MNRLRKFVVSTGFVLVASSLQLQALAEPVRGVEDPSNLLPMWSIIERVGLVQSTKTINNCSDGSCLKRDSKLSVSLVVIDNGPSTDVSPPQTLYLTMYNNVEETGIAYSVHQIEDIYDFQSARRVSAGIYEAVYQAFLPGEDCPFPILKTTIDARNLSAAVRKADDLAFMGDDLYFDDRIDVTRQILSCPGE